MRTRGTGVGAQAGSCQAGDIVFVPSLAGVGMTRLTRILKTAGVFFYTSLSLLFLSVGLILLLYFIYLKLGIVALLLSALATACIVAAFIVEEMY